MESASQPPKLGEVVSERREALSLSQDDLAWLARVSRNTVSNLERGKGASQNTIRRVTLALGGNHWSLESWDTRVEAFKEAPFDFDPWDESLNPASQWMVLQEHASGILRLILRTRIERPRMSRGLADEWLTYVSALADAVQPFAFEDPGEREGSFNRMCKEIPPLLEEGDEDVRSWLEDNGWTPEDDLPSEQTKPEAASALFNPPGSQGAPSELRSLWEDMRAWLELIEQQTKAAAGGSSAKPDALSKLPMHVQAEILNKDFGNAAVENPSSAPGVTHILLTLTDSAAPGFDQKKALDSLSDALCAQRIALDLMYKFDEKAPTLDEVVDVVRNALDVYGSGKRSGGWVLDEGRYTRKEGHDESS